MYRVPQFSEGEIIMVSGAPTPGGLKLTPPGGLHHQAAGGINATDYRAYQGHKNVDPVGPLSTSGPRALVSRGVKNVRKDAKTTGTPTYAWTLPTVGGGSTTAVGSISTPTAAQSTFLPDVAGTYVFRCTTTFPGSSGTVVTNFTYVSA
jgi:hypothetical protein